MTKKIENFPDDEPDDLISAADINVIAPAVKGDLVRIQCLDRAGLRIWCDDGTIMRPLDEYEVPAGEAAVYVSAGVAVII